MKPGITGRLIAAVGALVGLAMILMKLMPRVPGSFSGWEWLALALWIILGTVVSRQAGRKSVGAGTIHTSCD
jgi:hypothetical protein